MRKLLARERVPRTNGRRIHCICTVRNRIEEKHGGLTTEREILFSPFKRHAHKRHTLDQNCPHKVFPHFHVYDFARPRFFVPFLLPSIIHENNENKNDRFSAKESRNLFLFFLDEE